MIPLLVLAAWGAACLAGVRWLRVAQREHYVACSVLRFVRRWWGLGAVNPALAGVVLLAAIVASVAPSPGSEVAAAIALVGVAVGPVGLGIRGRTASVAWTLRLRRLALVSALPALAAGVVSVAIQHPAAVVWAVVLTPVWVDLGLAVLAPVERRLGDRWVRQAAAALERVSPRIAAITGSYGKTSTKGYVAHLLGGRHPVVASPASFNNRMGLARTVNEHLGDDTEIFVAEMGIFGPGEIADLCSWIPPEVGVITAIGPVHLERMGSLDAIAEAKREILAQARVGVLNVDSPQLARIADEEEGRIDVIRCSSRDRGVDVHCDPSTGEVWVRGEVVGSCDPAAVHPGNVACAVGVILALGLDPRGVADRLPTLPTPAHRQAVGRGERGFAIVDDTFNSNPAGARAALTRLTRLGIDGRRVLVTPGMVELGHLQEEENRRLAREAAEVVTDLVVVGHTNRRALVEGATEGGIGSVIVLPDREAAVRWVRDQLGPGDAVLYENDLPDHYP